MWTWPTSEWSSTSWPERLLSKNLPLTKPRQAPRPWTWVCPLFRRICNPAELNISIFNADNILKYVEVSWHCKCLYSLRRDYKSRRTLFRRICNPAEVNISILNAEKQIIVLWQHQDSHVSCTSSLRPSLTGWMCSPVLRQAIVESPEHYLYSSARNYVGEKGLIDVIVQP